MGYMLPAMLTGCLCFVADHLWRMHRLRRWLENTAALTDLAEADKRVGMVREVALDYSRLRSRYEEQHRRLGAAETYLQEAASSLSDGVIVVGGGGELTWANGSAKKLIGVSFPGHYKKLLVNVIVDQKFIDYFNQCDFSEPLEMVSPTTPHLTLSLSMTFFGAGNRLIFIRDISKVRHLEKMRQDFIGNMSHELRTPLTVIKGYLEVIDMHLDSESSRWRRPITQMQEQAERMENLITDLMWLSRLESVPQEDSDVAVAVAATAREMAEEASIHAAGQGKSFVIEVEDSIQLTGQFKELRSAFNNLVVNACKYSGEDGQVTISWRGNSDGGATFSVSDNGFGIAQHHLSRLTERFYRVDTSRSIATGGTGLGLAIVKHVMMRHDAELTINSEEGVGSTFSCVFPPSRVVRG
ncbi:two-component system phosphate regulon sensor histidine kinase PhoR [Sinobacterium caligoides]|uniref:histidine kinase n=2 Tax=Sinobacterium caligoides TaxID=933926 RepID=A0A3N2DYD2_9GAMM|nr:two-component system phosphate regulon sensor histidine kinase PhoR [Sinobacterium caligoides]